MLARFSRLIPMYQGIGTPSNCPARRCAPEPGRLEVLLFMALVVGLLRAGSVPTEGSQLAR